jgi:hypothetical protein
MKRKIIMCLHPKLIENPKYKVNKKNKGNVPVMKDKRLQMVKIPCMKCMICKKKKAREWKIRLSEEIKEQSKKGIKGNFITMTFSDEALVQLEKEVNVKVDKQIKESVKDKEVVLKIEKLSGYNLDNEIAIIAVKKFREHWRAMERKKPIKDRIKLRYWIVTELGGYKTERLHMHAIIWCNDEELIKERWKYGILDVGNKSDITGKVTNYVNEKTVNYIVKYVMKTDKKHPNYQSKIMASNGMGGGYLKGKNSENNKYAGKNTIRMYRTSQGYKMAMPKYYENNLWNENEREEMGIAYLNEHKQYIDGVEIDTSTEKGKEKYERVLNETRNKSKRLGYGSQEIDYEKRRYENEKRNNIKYIRHRKVIKMDNNNATKKTA